MSWDAANRCMWARECVAAERRLAGCDIFQIRATSVPGLGPAYFWLQIVCKMWFLQAPDTLCATDRVRTVVWGGRRRVKSGDAPIENHAFLFSQLSRAYIGPSIHPHRCTIAAALALILYPYYPHDATTTNTISSLPVTWCVKILHGPSSVVPPELGASSPLRKRATP